MRGRGEPRMTNGRRGGGQDVWPRPPPTITTSLEEMKKKIREFQTGKMSTEEQLAVVDWWIGQLLDMKANIRWGKRI